MRKLLLALFIITLTITVCAQKKQEKSKKPYSPYTILDSRIDNMGYWNKAANLGLTPFNPDITPEKPIFYGSKIYSKSVMFDDSPDVLVTTQNSTQSENSIFVDPNDPDHVLQSNNSTQNPVGSLYGADYLISFDFGQIWGGSIQGAGGGNSGDPAAAIGLNGRNYVGFIQSDGGQGVAYSTNNGTTWTSVQAGPTPGGSDILDKNHMWVDNSVTSPYVNNVYSAWTAFGNTNDLDIEIVRSTNSGTSYSTPINISSAVNAGSHNQGVNITTGPNGEVYVLWTIYDSWPSDEKALGFARSLNGGVSFQAPVRIIDNLKGIRNSGVGKNMRVNSFPSMTCDISGGPNNGNIFVVWCNKGVPGVNSSSGSQVWMIKSSNQGTTWSTPIQVNQDPISNNKQHYFPWITSDPETGVLSVIWYDDRNVSSTQAEVWCANSYDGGTTWEDFRVSDVAFTPSPIPGLASSYMGDYLGISARGGKVYPVWTDNRSGVTLTYCSPFLTNALERPNNLTASVTFETGQVQLNWSFNQVPTFQNFNIYRDDALIGTSTLNNYTDQLPDYGIYKYVVKAQHTTGESLGPSATAKWGDAHIIVTPEEINLSLMPDQQFTQMVNISNTGQLPLIFSASGKVNSSSKLAFCAASGGCDEYISNVTVGTINNSSSCSGYSDYSSISTEMNVGESYPITVSNGTPYSADQCGIWVDWNNNQDFTDDTPISVSGSPGNGPYSAVITPPAGSSGTVRMRIRITYTGSVSPCGTTTYGEVEDYTINVNSWLIVSPLTDTIAPGESANVPVLFNTTDMSIGTYSGQVKIASNDPLQTLVTIPVSLLVGYTVYPIIQVDPASVEQNVALGGTASGTFNISNTGNALLSFAQEVEYIDNAKWQQTNYKAGTPVTLINEPFSGTTLPAGWAANGLGLTNWTVVNTNNAIGSPPELRMNWTPTFNGISRMVLPTFNTVDMTDLTFSFRHMIDFYASGTTCGIAYSTDGGSNWTSVWSVSPTANVLAELRTISIPNPDNGSANFKMCFYFSGNSFNIDYWYIDNVQFTATYNPPPPPPPPYTWLVPTPLIGTVEEGEMISVNLDFIADTLPVGTYQANLIITNNGLTGAKTIPVTMNVINEYLNVLPSFVNATFESGQAEFEISTNIAWNATTDADWITMTPQSGNGNATLNVQFSENTSLNSRQAIITVSPAIDQQPVEVIITQDGKPCNPGWVYTNTASSHTISIPLSSNPDIFGQPIQDGDWIGVFFAAGVGIETCAGYTRWDGISNITVTAFGDDPTTPEKDGFLPGEFIQWKIYQCSTSTLFPAFATYDPNLPNSTGVFVPFGLSRLLQLSTSVTQILDLPGAWSGVSLFVNPLIPAVSTIFEPAGNNMIILYDNQYVYWPETNLNTIGDWNTQTAYAVKMNAPQTLELEGIPVYPATLELNPGWYYLPMLSACEVSTDQLFSGLTEDIMIIKDMAGTGVYWPSMGINTLPVLSPGDGYLIKAINPVTINFPLCAGNGSSKNALSYNLIHTFWGNIKVTPGSHLIAIPEEVKKRFVPGDQIGVFGQDDHIMGFGVISENSTPDLVCVFSDDPSTPEKDGLVSGETMNFKLFSEINSKDYDLCAEYSNSFSNHDGTFIQNGLSAFKSLEIVTGISDRELSSVQIYPNPAKEIVHISGLKPGRYGITISNMSGEQLYINETSTDCTINFSGISAGVYNLMIKSDQGIRIEKLIVK